MPPLFSQDNYKNNSENKSLDAKWDLLAYQELIEKLKSNGILDPDELFFPGTFITYNEEDNTYLITMEKQQYIIYKFHSYSPDMLGTGENGNVFAGKNLATGEDVAIKTGYTDSLYGGRYKEIPLGWSLVKTRLNQYEYFAKIFHYGDVVKTKDSEALRVFLVMEKLELELLVEKNEGTIRIKDVDHLRTLLAKAFDAITIMYCHDIYWDNRDDNKLHLDEHGNLKLIGYNNWKLNINKRIGIRQANVNYSSLLRIIELYYVKLGVSSISTQISSHRTKIETMSELFSKRDFFEITEEIINEAENRLSSIKNVNLVSFFPQSNYIAEQNLMAYQRLIDTLKSEYLLKPCKDFSPQTFMTYNEEYFTYIITAEDNQYVVYKFSTDKENILGQGDCAVVYAGKNLATGRDVAIKTSKPSQDQKFIGLQYNDVPPGWELVKTKLSNYRYFPRIFHFGVDIETTRSKYRKVYLVMEKLELKSFLVRATDAKNIINLRHLRNILDNAFDAITILYNHNIRGIDWGNDNLKLDAQGKPKFIDYDYWVEDDNKQVVVAQTNYSYSKLLGIIEVYYTKLSIYSIVEPSSQNRKRIEKMEKIISKEDFFKIADGLINEAENYLSNKEKENKIAIASMKFR